MSTDDDGREWDVASDELGYIHQDTLDCWRINYRLDLTPHELAAVWEAGAPAGAVLALRCAVAGIVRLQVTLHHVESGLLAAEEERDELREVNDRFARRQAWWTDRMFELEAQCEAGAASEQRWIDWLVATGLLRYHNACHRPDGSHGPAWVLRAPSVIDGDSCVAWHAESAAGALREFLKPPNDAHEPRP